jgi:acyl transferase domain-containing protein/predicted O-methyltransferase YrrM
MRDKEQSRVNEPIMSLPLCCSLQIALVELLKSWGIRPTAVTGHSSGEVAAAYAAGAIDMREALAIVYMRGALTSAFIKRSAVRGGMLAVGLGPEDAEPYLAQNQSGKVVIACVNSPSSVTLSGDIDGIEAIEGKLIADKIFARKLNVEAAYHSHHMQPLVEDYRVALTENLKQNGNFDGVLFSSPVTGKLAQTAAEIGPEHWIQNMIQPVLFSQSLKNMCIGVESSVEKQYIDTLIEIGPHGALGGPIRQILSQEDLKDRKITYGTCLVRGQDATLTMQGLVCSLLSKGYPADLAAVNFPQSTQGLEVLHDLPPYPWNHSVSHWAEPRINKEYRHRKYPSLDLLGSRVAATNPAAPTWRQLIRPTEIPWIRDHLVQNDLVYPGAGNVVRAIEAMRQLHWSPETPIAGYNLRNVQFMKAMVIPDVPEGLEVQISLIACSEKSLDKDGWTQFSIRSYGTDGVWKEHVKGLISVTFKNGFCAEPAMKKTSDIESGGYIRRIDPNLFFKGLASAGVYHGPIFQNMISCKSGQDKSVATFAVADVASVMPKNFQHKHVIHPTTLDSLLQAGYMALPAAAGRQMGITMPTSIKTMFVSEDIGSEAGHQFHAFTDLHRHSLEGFEVSISTVNQGAEESPRLLEIGGMYYQSLGSSSTAKEPVDATQCMTLHWERDLSFLTRDYLRDYLKMPPDPAEIEIVKDLRRATFHIVHDTLSVLKPEQIPTLEWYYQRFYNWMKVIDDLALQNRIAPTSSQWIEASHDEKQILFDKVAEASVNGKMLCRFRENLLAILRKEVAPLELMLKDKLLYTFYENSLKVDRSLVQVGKLVQLFAHRNPRAKVLEIGGGTGACTGTVLKALDQGTLEPNSGFVRYDFTDISSGFFETAKEKFSAWDGLMTYSKLDIEQDPGIQSFELGSYDLIIACEVLHATVDMEKTMTNVRRLLKPGGTLLMVETTQDIIDVQLVFGTLPGWWLSIQS